MLGDRHVFLQNSHKDRLKSLSHLVFSRLMGSCNWLAVSIAQICASFSEPKTTSVVKLAHC